MVLIIGITGASGVIYGIRLLEVLSEMHDIETHLVISKHAETVILTSDVNSGHETFHAVSSPA
jgi:4-hydroxy-3-polyprenylbenzoate decarboxylase